mgnify:CR=1 FL=1
MDGAFTETFLEESAELLGGLESTLLGGVSRNAHDKGIRRNVRI